MKIELRKIKHAAYLSQETEAFTAELWIDGKKRGHVENDGHGGSHNYSDWPAHKELSEYAKTLPRREFPKEWGSPTGDGDNTYPVCADTLVDDLLGAHLKEKQDTKERNKLLKAMKTKTLFRKVDSKPGEYAYFPGTDQRILDHIAKKYPTATIITPANLDLILKTDDEKEAVEA